MAAEYDDYFNATTLYPSREPDPKMLYALIKQLEEQLIFLGERVARLEHRMELNDLQ